MNLWGRIDREIEYHWAYEPDREYTKREALFWIYLHIRFESGYDNIRGTKVYIKKGQLATSIRRLRKTWNWKTDRKVIKFLEDLVASGDILLEKSSLGVLITVLNRVDSSTIGEVYHRIKTVGVTNKLWMQTTPASNTDQRQPNEGEGEKSDPLAEATAEQREIIGILQSIPGYPADDEKDLLLIQQISAEYPEVDLLKTAKAYKDWFVFDGGKSDSPRTSFMKLCEAREEKEKHKQRVIDYAGHRANYQAHRKDYRRKEERAEGESNYNPIAHFLERWS